MTMSPANEPHGFPGDEDYEDADYSEIDALLGARAPAIAWPEIGAKVEGTIIKMQDSVQTDIDGNIQRYPSGEVRKQVVLTLQTKLKDNADDDGVRTLYVKSFMTAAFRDALQKADAPGPRPGGKVKVTYTGNGEPKRKGLNPPKLFAVIYTKP
jgi:hypothetical protein